MTNPAKAIHIVTGGKGNVGKSAFSTAIACISSASGNKSVLIDADIYQQTLSSLHKDSIKIVLSEDPELDSQPDRIWLEAEKAEGDVIVDLAAEGDPIVNTWLEERDVVGAAEHYKIPIYKWWLADMDEAATAKLVELCKSSDGIQYVLVKNLSRKSRPYWDAYIEEHTDLKALIGAGTLKHIDFPKIGHNLIVNLRNRGITFREAVLDTGYKKVGILDQGTVTKWIQKVAQEIGTVYTFPKAKEKAPAK